MPHAVPFIRSPYNYDVKEASDAVAYHETMPSLTVQSMTEDSDLNVMMKRFGVTGIMPENVRQPTYGDFTHVTDYRSAIEASRAAEESFMQFPADIRSQFENNPQLFLDFVENPANINTVKQWFPKENLNGEAMGYRQGAAPGVGSSASSQGSGASGNEPAQRGGSPGGVDAGVKPGGAHG